MRLDIDIDLNHGSVARENDNTPIPTLLPAFVANPDLPTRSRPIPPAVISTLLHPRPIPLFEIMEALIPHEAISPVPRALHPPLNDSIYSSCALHNASAWTAPFWSFASTKMSRPSPQPPTSACRVSASRPASSPSSRAPELQRPRTSTSTFPILPDAPRHRPTIRRAAPRNRPPAKSSHKIHQMQQSHWEPLRDIGE